MTLQVGLLITWKAIYNKFMGSYYSHQRIVKWREKITTFFQLNEEIFHEIWDRFKLFLNKCSDHIFPLQV